jgi:hypothetical protein
MVPLPLVRTHNYYYWLVSFVDERGRSCLMTIVTHLCPKQLVSIHFWLVTC